MSVSVIPNRTDLVTYRLRADSLDGTIFRLDFRWNRRSEYWFMDILTDDETPILMGVKVALGVPLLRLVTNLDRPLGELIAVDTTNTGTEAAIDTLGDIVRLTYLDQSETAALGA